MDCLSRFIVLRGTLFRFVLGVFFFGMEGVHPKRTEVLPPFHNVIFFSIVHVHIDINESKYIYMSRFINI